MNMMTWVVMGALLSAGTVGFGVERAAAASSPVGPAMSMAAEQDMTGEVEQSARSRQATGTIVSVDRQAKTVTIKSRTGEQTFALSPRVRVKLGNLKATLAEVQPGKKVFIRYRDIDGAATATTVKVL